MGFMLLQKRPHRTPSPLPPCEDSEKAPVVNKDVSLPQSSAMVAPDLGLPNLQRTLRNNFLFSISYPVCGILFIAVWAKTDTILSFHVSSRL